MELHSTVVSRGISRPLLVPVTSSAADGAGVVVPIPIFCATANCIANDKKKIKISDTLLFIFCFDFIRHRFNSNN